MLNMFKIIGILGLISIIAGTFMISLKRKIRRKFIYPFLLIGGFLMTIYSYYINDLIFIILEIVYTLVVIYEIIKLSVNTKK